MTVSETTRLLPLQENHDVEYPAMEWRNQTSHRKSRFYVLAAVGLTAVMVLLYSSRGATRASASATSEWYFDDAVLLQWDVWRSEAAHTVSSLGDSVAGVVDQIPNATHSVQSQLQSDVSRLGSWWDGTAATRDAFVQGVADNAQRFGDQVKHWWDDAAVTSAHAVAQANVTDKVQAIESRFQHWWAHASAEERAWWNATQQQLQVDAQRGGDWLHHTTEQAGANGGAWWDATQSALQGDAEKVGHAGAEWFNATSHHVQSWEGTVMDASKKELSKDAAAVSHVGKEWLNGTQAALQRGEEKATEAWQSDKAAAKLKGMEFLNDTGAVIQGEEAAAAEQTGKWWHSVQEAAHKDVVAVQDEEHVLWNASQAALRHDRDAAEERFALWWSTTKAYAQSKWHQASDQEAEWWNATELWFHDHIAQLQPKSTEKNSRALLYLNDSYAYSLLMNGYHWLDYSTDFFLLQGGWDVQLNQGYCAIASAAAVMNSFRPTLEIPIDPVYSPHPYATQDNLFNHCVQKTVVHRNATYDGVLQPPGGLSLSQLQQFLRCHNLNATLTYVNPANVTVDTVRQELRAALMHPQQRVLVNYDRRGVGQDGGGHFSPLAAYAPQLDALLLLDVAKYKYPPVWIPTERLYLAMAMEDGCGDWDFPKALDKVPSNFYPNSSKEYARILRRLKCRKMFRGYIVVQLPV